MGSRVRSGAAAATVMRKRSSRPETVAYAGERVAYVGEGVAYAGPGGSPGGSRRLVIARNRLWRSEEDLKPLALETGRAAES